MLVLPLGVNAQSTERIVNYHSNIEVKQDASMVVTETIKVISAGEQIKRGIYRDFPIAYTDQTGRRYSVGFEVLGIYKDGEVEGYHTERAGNGVRVYVGKQDVFIAPGEYEYKIVYKTTRQLGFFEDHDELYWNVTGNGWVFPIESAGATVKLPGNILSENITVALYTGAQGSTDKEGTYNITNGTVEFASSKPLGVYEGLTIVVGFPKGMVAAPTVAENFAEALRSNLDYIVGILGFLLVLVFYFYMWYKKGRDPKKGTVIPLYEPPLKFSPAMVGYVRKMGSDNKNFAAAIIALGVKGALTITESKEGWLKSTVYTLNKKEGELKQPLADEEKILLGELFIDSGTLKLDKTNSAEIIEARSSFADSLKEQAGKTYFAKNILVIVFGVIISFAVLFATGISSGLVRFGPASLLSIIFWPVLILSLVAVNIIFGLLIRAYTVVGRKLADEIEGFKLFLMVTEKDRLQFHNPPEKTPELFEKMLPYALALGVEHEWAKQFAGVFEGLKKQGVSYAPLWYFGSLAHFNAETFTSNVSSAFAGAVTSASTPSGSSSGFSGSSGGGGGGGGGGGW